MKSTSKLYKLFAAYIVISVTGTRGIKVSFGTNVGPILPPTPEPKIIPIPPFREPAPVWEEQSGDVADPNAAWRPPPFVPQTRYTQVNFNAPPPLPSPLPTQTSAQRFVNAYLPNKPTQLPSPSPVAPIQYVNGGQPPVYFRPAYNPTVVPQLSSQNVPGFGIRYFVPTYVNDQQHQQSELSRQEDVKQNHIESNYVAEDGNEHVNDLELKYQKESARRATRASQEATQTVYFYQWPAYVPPRHQ